MVQHQPLKSTLKNVREKSEGHKGHKLKARDVSQMPKGIQNHIEHKRHDVAELEDYEYSGSEAYSYSDSEEYGYPEPIYDEDYGFPEPSYVEEYVFPELEDNWHLEPNHDDYDFPEPIHDEEYGSPALENNWYPEPNLDENYGSAEPDDHGSEAPNHNEENGFPESEHNGQLQLGKYPEPSHDVDEPAPESDFSKFYKDKSPKFRIAQSDIAYVKQAQQASSSVAEKGKNNTYRNMMESKRKNRKKKFIGKVSLCAG